MVIHSLKKGIFPFADKNEASLMSKVHFEETSEDEEEDEQDGEEAEVNGAEEEEDEPSQLETKVYLTISNY